MSNTINIPQEVIEQLVQKEVEKKINETITVELLNRLIRSFVVKSLDMAPIEVYLNKVLDSQMTDAQSFLNTTITTKIERSVSEWITNNKWNIESLIKQAITSLVKSNETYNRYVEPLITKYIAEDASFIPYAKNEINIKLNEKIKNFNKLVGDNISSKLVKDFLQEYLTNRNLNDQPEEL